MKVKNDYRVQYRSNICWKYVGLKFRELALAIEFYYKAKYGQARIINETEFGSVVVEEIK